MDLGASIKGLGKFVFPSPKASLFTHHFCICAHLPTNGWDLAGHFYKIAPAAVPAVVHTLVSTLALGVLVLMAAWSQRRPPRLEMWCAFGNLGGREHADVLAVLWLQAHDMPRL